MLAQQFGSCKWLKDHLHEKVVTVFMHRFSRLDPSFFEPQTFMLICVIRLQNGRWDGAARVVSNLRGSLWWPSTRTLWMCVCASPGLTHARTCVVLVLVLVLALHQQSAYTSVKQKAKQEITVPVCLQFYHVYHQQGRAGFSYVPPTCSVIFVPINLHISFKLVL